LLTEGQATRIGSWRFHAGGGVCAGFIFPFAGRFNANANLAEGHDPGAILNRRRSHASKRASRKKILRRSGSSFIVYPVVFCFIWKGQPWANITFSRSWSSGVLRTAGFRRLMAVEPVVSEGTGYRVVVPADSVWSSCRGSLGRPRFRSETISVGATWADKALSNAAIYDGETCGSWRTRRYTSHPSDLNIVLRLFLPETNGFPQGANAGLCYARDLRMDDVRSRQRPSCLASVDGSPWVGLFREQLNFRFFLDPKKRQGAPILLNSNIPLAGEGSRSCDITDGSWHNTLRPESPIYQPWMAAVNHTALGGHSTMAGERQAAGELVLKPGPDAADLTTPRAQWQHSAF